MTNEPIDEQELIESINRNDYFWISKINFKNTECRVLQDIFIVKGKKFEHINVFIYAILANKITVVSLFVNSPMKSNFMYESWTPLHLVAFLNYVEIANLLLANEYPLDVKDVFLFFYEVFLKFRMNLLQ
jgi:hypothetical protein